MVRPMVNSQKRIQGITLRTIALGAVENIDIAECVQDLGNGENSVLVVPGTVIKAIYVEVWLGGVGTGATSTTTAFVWRSPSGSDNPTSVDFTNLNTWNNKNNILEMHQGLIPNGNANPIPHFRGWIKIPKGKQRASLGDRLVLSVKAITDEVDVCGLVIFKAYN